MEKAKTLRKGFIVPKGKKIKNGELTLTGGRIDERFAYFRSESFVNLLNNETNNDFNSSSLIVTALPQSTFLTLDEHAQ